jgi:hypothetical protein
MAGCARNDDDLAAHHRHRGIFAFDADFVGSAGGVPHSKPMTSFVGTPTGKGYWMSTTATPTGAGYWLIGSDGAVYPFGDAAPLPAR